MKPQDDAGDPDTLAVRFVIQRAELARERAAHEKTRTEAARLADAMSRMRQDIYRLHLLLGLHP